MRRIKINRDKRRVQRRRIREDDVARLEDSFYSNERVSKWNLR